MLIISSWHRFSCPINIFQLSNRDFEDGTSLDGSIEHMERGSIASFGSGNTTDSDNKVNHNNNYNNNNNNNNNNNHRKSFGKWLNKITLTHHYDLNSNGFVTWNDSYQVARLNSTNFKRKRFSCKQTILQLFVVFKWPEKLAWHNIQINA